MSTARERILGRLRSVPSADVAAPAVGAWYASQEDDDASARVGKLTAALEASHAEVHHCASRDWSSVVLRIAEEKSLRTLLVGAGTPHGEALRRQNDSGNATKSDLQIVDYAASFETWRERLFENIDAGLSVAHSAIAETGSLILWTGPSEPRLLSLVPPVHFVLLDVDRIHATLYAAMQTERWSAGLPTNVLLVSGPSKTADIQQTLAYGAHGPRELVVILRHADGGAS